jgi:hypothetical protein
MGETSVKMQAELTAATALTEASLKEASTKQQLVESMTQELEKRQQVIATNKQVSEKYKETTQALADKIAKTKEEAAASVTAVEAAKLEEAQRKINIETLKDNSSRTSEFSEAVKKAREQVAFLVQAKKDGLPVDAQLKAAQIELATATRLYGDAVADNVRNIELAAKAKKTESDGVVASLNARKAEIDSLIKVAEVNGKDRDAINLKIEAKRIEIQIIKETVEATNREIESRIKALKAQRDSIQGTDDAAAARRRELNVQIEQERVRQTESDSRLSGIRGIESEIQSLGKAARARAEETSSIEANTSEREKAIAAKEKELELRDREAAISKQGSASMSSDIATRTGILNFLKQAGVTDEAVAKRLANEFADQNGNVVYSNNPGQLKYGGRNSTLSEALLKAAETYTFSDAALNPKTAATPTTPTTATAKTSAAPAPTTVNISINGVSKSVNVASASDAAALTAILRQLETSANSAS